MRTFILRQMTSRMTAARIICVISTPLLISYLFIYVAAILCACLFGENDLLDTLKSFTFGHLTTQLPMLVMLVAVSMICVLTESLSVGVVWRISNGLALPGRVDLYDMLLRIADQLRGLASPNRIDGLVPEFALHSLLASCKSSTPPLAGGWAPSDHPSLS